MRPLAQSKERKGSNFAIWQHCFKVILEFLRSARLSGDIGGCTLEKLEWEADYFCLEALLKIIRERKEAEKESKAVEERKKAEEEARAKDEKKEKERLECLEKAAEMRKKSAEARKMEGKPGKCPFEKEIWHEGCISCNDALKSAEMYASLAEEYDNKCDF